VIERYGGQRQSPAGVFSTRQAGVGRFARGRSQLETRTSPPPCRWHPAGSGGRTDRSAGWGTISPGGRAATVKRHERPSPPTPHHRLPPIGPAYRVSDCRHPNRSCASTRQAQTIAKGSWCRSQPGVRPARGESASNGLLAGERGTTDHGNHARFVLNWAVTHR